MSMIRLAMRGLPWLGWALLGAQETPSKAEALVPRFEAACAAGDAAGCREALLQLANAPDAATALPTLMKKAADVPVPALVELSRLVADLLPYGLQDDREAASRFADALEARASAFAKAQGGLQLHTLANEVSRCHARGMVDASARTEVLVRQVEDAFEQVREAACEALGRRGAAAVGAVEPLLHLLQRDLPENGHTKMLGVYFRMQDRPRHAAARALLAIAPKSPAIVPAHQFLLTNGDTATERRAAALALGALGKAATDAVPALVAAAQDQDHGVAGDAILALGMIGKPAAAARPVLERIAAGGDKMLAALAAAALRQIERG